MGNNENEQEQYQESPNPKLQIMWEALSENRQKEINMRIVNSIKKFESSGQLELGKTYPLEFTFGFDKEEPIQYVYLMCAFRLIKPDKPIQINKNLPPAKTIMDIAMRDIEVFKADNMYDWVDHVNRLNKNSEQNKEDQLFYENNIFENKKQEGDSGKKEVENTSEKKSQQQDKSNPPNQCNINKPIDVKELDNENEMFGRVLFPDTENENKPKYVLHGIEESELFDFYDEEVSEKSNEEYLSIFRLYSRNMVNQVMRGYYGHKIDFDANEKDNDDDENNNDDTDVVLGSLYSLKNLQASFCKCDFWKFNKYELGQLGFINWSDELLLIPIWAFPIILRNSRDKILYCPNNENIIVKNIDITEHPSSKYGCVPYGFKINEIK